MSDVRSKTGDPIASDFDGRDGTPIVIDLSAKVAYAIDDVGSIFQIGGGGGGSVTSTELSAAIAGQSARTDSVANAVSVVSQALSALSQTNSAEHAALSGRITSVAGLAGGGSVTSAELAQGLSLVSVAAQSAINTVSNAISVLSVAHQSLVDRVSANSGVGGGSVTSAELVQGLSLVSVAAQSAVNTVSAAVDSLSNANSAAHVSIVGRVDTVSAAAANALSVANAASNKGSVLSVNLASVDARVTSVGNAVSVVSQALSALSQANSAAHASIDGRVTSVANAVSVVSQALSALSQTNSVDHAALSNRITSVAGLAGGGSVTSAEVQAVSAAAASADGTLSTRLDSVVNRVSANSGVGGGGSVTSAELIALSATLQSAINTVSAAAAAAGGPQIRKIVNTQSTNASALVDISGLVLTVAAGETWEIEGMYYLSTSATTVGLRMGWSVPPLSIPRFGVFMRHSGGQSAGIGGAAGQLQVSGASINMSIGGGGPAAGGYIVRSKHVMAVASAGTVRLMYAGIASTVASPIHILPGSYLKAIKI